MEGVVPLCMVGVAAVLGVLFGLLVTGTLPKARRWKPCFYITCVGGVCVIAVIAYLIGKGMTCGTVFERDENDIPKFDKSIQITHPKNNKFATFLKRNVGRVVHLSTYIDLSVATKKQQNTARTFNIDAFSTNHSVPLPIKPPYVRDHGIGTYVEFHLRDDRELRPSFAGTGTVIYPLVGWFKVTQTAGPPSKTTYHLTELPVSISIESE